MEPTTIRLVVEDSLHENILRKVLSSASLIFEVDILVLGNRGKSYIKNKIASFNHAAAQGDYYLVLVDLDNEYNCPVELVQNWLPSGSEPSLILRVAVREAEAWLLADKAGLASFLGISQDIIRIATGDADLIDNPKRTIVNLARRSRKRIIKNEIVPSHQRSDVGYGYNAQMEVFVRTQWNIIEASNYSTSLRSFISKLKLLSQNGT